MNRTTRYVAGLALLLLASIVPAQEKTWPRTFVSGGQTVVIEAPQVDEWKDYAQLTFRCVVSVTASEGATPKLGVIECRSLTRISVEARTALLTDLTFDVRFTSVPEAERPALEALVRDVLPKEPSIDVSLDRLFAHVLAAKEKTKGVELNLDPPKILASGMPAVLMIFAGKPAYQPVTPGSRLMFAVNTNWDLFFAPDKGRYYLLNDGMWLETPDLLKGPWGPPASLPGEISQLPADANWEDVRKSLPPKASSGAAPVVFVSDEPAELILTDGPPRYSPIAGTQLMYATNTDSPLFLHTGTKEIFYLVAGRWFKSQALVGPWTSASANLPPDFLLIPEDSPVAYVLPSIPGTDEAKDAVLLASVPQKATISRKDLTLTVLYDGPPKFEPIQGSQLHYATNSPNAVFLTNNRYYCCHQGVWFESAAATGPWEVCISVPPVIYTIPPSSPLHNVTYVQVYNSTPETVVVGTTSGYTGEYIAATGVVMFGAGVVVAALIAADDVYIHSSYHSGFYSYGCGARYSYSTGNYYRSAQSYGPYGGAGRYAAYNPSSGTYSRGAYRYGPSGGAYAKQAYNPWTNTYAARAGGSNGYQSWSRGVVQDGDDWVAGGRNSGPRGSAGWVETSEGNAAVGAKGRDGGRAVATNNGNVYAGKDGNVYKREDGGGWQKYDGGGDWDSADRPDRPDRNQNNAQSRQPNSEVQSRLNSDRQARQTGAQRETRTRQSRSGGGRRR